MKIKFFALCMVIPVLCACSVYEKTKEIISENKAETQQIEYRTLIVDENKEIYRYEDMEQDLETISLAYKDRVSLDVIGTTLDGRNIYDMVIGKKTAPVHMIIHGSIHAREYITTKLIMKQLAYYLSCLDNGTGEYKQIPYSELFKDTALHIVPMVNPDGVTISQSGIDGLRTQAAKASVRKIVNSDGGAGGFTQWKANANGVDLNRNYDAMWEEFVGAGRPASDRYKGAAPASEPETKALIGITRNNPVVRTISYHTYGQVIYWYFGQTGDLYSETKAFADEISEITGYAPDANYEQLDPAGYKDWALDKLGIPSITIEVGYGKNPVPNSQFEGIRNQNKDVWAGMLYNYKYN